MRKASPKTKVNHSVSMSTIISTIAMVNKQPSAFQLLRRQPVPVATGLELIELGKTLSSHVDSFNEAIQDLQARHFKGSGQPSKAAQENFQKDYQALLDRKVTLKWTPIPRVLLTEAKMTTDHLEAVLWLLGD